jgi:uncharacterized repeat protein (TIGR03803 family)
LYAFPKEGDERGGPYAGVTFDGAGNLFGTTSRDGACEIGSVFQLTPSNGGWTETDLSSFCGSGEGNTPHSNVILDAHGNLYGTTLFGDGNGCQGTGCGVVWEITP